MKNEDAFRQGERRFTLQGGYHIVRGVDLASLSNSDASGFTLGGALKFGGF
jgi:hypothetical protein